MGPTSKYYNSGSRYPIPVFQVTLEALQCPLSFLCLELGSVLPPTRSKSQLLQNYPWLFSPDSLLNNLLRWGLWYSERSDSRTRVFITSRSSPPINFIIFSNQIWPREFFQIDGCNRPSFSLPVSAQVFNLNSKIHNFFYKPPKIDLFLNLKR